MWRFLKRALVLVLALLVAILVWLYVVHGSGKPYPNVSTAPLLPESALQKLVLLDLPPGNVAVAKDGRIFFNTHPFVKAERIAPATVFELVGGKPQPYPDAEFQKKFQGVFGMTVDAQNRLWMIEPRGLDHARTRLLAFDLSSNKLVFEHWFEGGAMQFAQDLRVSPDGRTVYLADTGLFRFTKASLMVLDIASKSGRTVLQDFAGAQQQDWIIRGSNAPGSSKPHKLGFGLVTFAVGLDGIELSADGSQLYFGAMSNDTLYRVPTAALLNAQLSAQALHAQILAVGQKPLSDGITLDAQGRIVITDVENNGLARLSADGKLQTLVRSPNILWADGVVRASDGSLLFTDSAIPWYIDQLARLPSIEKLKAGAPYAIYRVATPAAN
jgi:hypothetical protein